MHRVDPRLVLGATLYTTPGLKGGIRISGLLCILIVVVVVLVGLLLYRHGGSRPGQSDPNPGDGWGKGPRGPEPQDPGDPRGGIPLDDATPARVRMRGKGRLADLRPRRVRRPAREPDRAPTRTPHI
jgi:hypothetical protein